MKKFCNLTSTTASIVFSLAGLDANRAIAIPFSDSNQSRHQHPQLIAQGQTINLTQSGSGLFTLEARPNQNIRRVSVIGRSDGKVDLVFFMTGGSRARFSGNLTSRDAYSLDIELISYGQASASGTITVEYGDNNSINSIYGDGELDGQDFSVQFSR